MCFGGESTNIARLQKYIQSTVAGLGEHSGTGIVVEGRLGVSGFWRMEVRVDGGGRFGGGEGNSWRGGRETQVGSA